MRMRTHNHIEPRSGGGGEPHLRVGLLVAWRKGPAHAGMDTMIITDITLNPHSAPAPDDLTGMGRLVREITDTQDTTRPRALWDRTRPDRLLVLSEVAPEWDLVPGALRASATQAPRFSAGDRIHWHITCDIVRTEAKRGPDGLAIGRGKKVAVKDRETARSWIRDRLDGPLGSVQVNTCASLPRTAGGPNRWHMTGTGAVADGAALAELQAAGIGRSKAQGCGLLLIQEVPQKP